MSPELKELFNNLTRLQKGICLNLLDGAPYAKAYFDAGGISSSDDNAKSIVSRMVSTDVNVKAFLDAADKQAVSNAVMTKREALERLSVLAGTDISDIVDPRTGEIKDGVDEAKFAALCEINVTDSGVKYKTHSATTAIRDLAAILGWNAPTKVAETDSEGNDKEGMSERELARRVAFMLAQGVKESDA